MGSADGYHKDRYLPKPVDYAKRGRERAVIHSADGPACFSRWTGDGLSESGGALVQIKVGPRQGARRLSSDEVWCLQGGSSAEWAAEREAGRSDMDVLRETAFDGLDQRIRR